MNPFLGILFAFISLIAFGLGDFFIQKTTRTIGSWKALFFIGVVGFIGLFPFIYKDFEFLTSFHVVLLVLLSIVGIFGSLFYFDALKRGKIAIIEPIMGIELPITIGLSVFFAKESLSVAQIFFISMVFFGSVLAMTIHKAHLHYHRRIFEKGVILAGVGAISMALTNFLIGVSSQTISPLMTIWFAHFFLTMFCGAYIFFQGEFLKLFSDFKKHTKIILGQSFFDNIAWIAFAFATTKISISIATTISEGYIALSVLLGLFVNRERLKIHQKIGVTLTIGGILALSYFSS